MEQELQLGDVVVLNSGGPKMTVIELSGDQVRVVWIDLDDELESAWFPRPCVFKPRLQPSVGAA